MGHQGMEYLIEPWGNSGDVRLHTPRDISLRRCSRFDFFAQPFGVRLHRPSPLIPEQSAIAKPHNALTTRHPQKKILAMQTLGRKRF